MPNVIDHAPDWAYIPSDRNVTVWRYMDLAGFVAMLSSNALSFCRADMFLDDPYEGTLPRSLYKEIISQGGQWRLDLYDRIRRSTFLNCWHMNPSESFAMWKLYVPGGKGVAIRSTFNSLATYIDHEVGDHRIHLAGVIYTDNEFEVSPNPNGFNPLFFLKRKAFEHEREIRLYAPPSNVPKTPCIHTRLDVPVRLNELVHEIRVSPDAGAWFRGIVTEITAKYGLIKNVEQSVLCVPPVSYVLGNAI